MSEPTEAPSGQINQKTFSSPGLSESIKVGDLLGADEASIKIDGESYVVHPSGVSDAQTRQNIIAAVIGAHVNQRGGIITWRQIGIGKVIISIEVR